MSISISRQKLLLDLMLFFQNRYLLLHFVLYFGPIHVIEMLNGIIYCIFRQI